MLRSNVASSEIASEASLRNYIDRADVLSDVLSGEGHISYCNRVLRLSHLEQSSSSGEFVSHSFMKFALSSLFLRVFVSHNSAGFRRTFHLHILYKGLKYFRQKC